MKPPPPSRVLAEADRSLETCGRVALCQIVATEGATPGKAGWKLLVRPDGTTFGNLGGGAFEALAVRDARARLETSASGCEIKRYYLTESAVHGEATGMVCGGFAEVLHEVLSAPPLVVVCGGGPVGQAVAAAARACDFDCLVIDDRAEFRRPELFPEGVRTTTLGRSFERTLEAAERLRDVYVAVVSRCWQTDLAAVAAVLEDPPERLRYLGLMGSRRKVERVACALTERGLDPGRVPYHAPIGLDLGAQTPPELALSIVGELVRERRRRPLERRRLQSA